MSYGTTMDGINLDSSSSSYYKAGPVASVAPGPDIESINNNGDGVELKSPIVPESNYNIGEASYPDGIASDSDKQHYIRFFVNMRSKSEFLVNEKEKNRLSGKAVATAEQEAFKKN